VVGQGTHAELLAACPQYREIAYSQLSPEELDGVLDARKPLPAASEHADGGERA